MTRYWQITDGLRQDKSLTDQIWQEFLEIPGNKIYVRGIYSATDLVRYRKAIEVVYMPRYDSLRRTKLQAKNWFHIMVNDYKEREPEYRRYVVRLTQNATALDLMYQYAYPQLPPAARKRVTTLNIYYEALGNDATSQTDGMFYSLRAVLDANEVKPDLMEGHEMYHQLQSGRDFGTIAPKEEGLLEIMASMQYEGIADQIDNPWPWICPATRAASATGPLRQPPALFTAWIPPCSRGRGAGCRLQAGGTGSCRMAQTGICHAFSCRRPSCATATARK